MNPCLRHLSRQRQAFGSRIGSTTNPANERSTGDEFTAPTVTWSPFEDVVNCLAEEGVLLGVLAGIPICCEDHTLGPPGRPALHLLESPGSVRLHLIKISSCCLSTVVIVVIMVAVVLFVVSTLLTVISATVAASFAHLINVKLIKAPVAHCPGRVGRFLRPEVTFNKSFVVEESPLCPHDHVSRAALLGRLFDTQVVETSGGQHKPVPVGRSRARSANSGPVLAGTLPPLALLCRPGRPSIPH